MRTLEICAGAGGQALGLEQAGFSHVALVEIDPSACDTLRINRPQWNVIETDVKEFSAKKFRGIELFAGGLPCPPFSIAGKQLGQIDERDLFPKALRLIEECNPKAVMLENVRGLFFSKFDNYRASIISKLESLGYLCRWESVNAIDYGIPQRRERTVLIALKTRYFTFFDWPSGNIGKSITVGKLLMGEMAKNGWEGAHAWAKHADGVAPTLVGGSKKHGGPDLGPVRAKKAWLALGVNGNKIADAPPPQGFVGNPSLTVPMAALVQGFPKDWRFLGGKTSAYKQVGNAFPPPVAKAFGEAILKALQKGSGKGDKRIRPEQRIGENEEIGHRQTS